MPSLFRLRRVSAVVLVGAALFDVVVRRAGLGAAGLRLKSESAFLAAWEDLAVRVGTFPLRCLLYAGLLATAAAGLDALIRGGAARRIAAGLALLAAAAAAAGAVTGSSLPGALPFGAAAALALGAVAASEERSRSRPLAARVFGFGVAFALGGDALHRVWAEWIRRRGSPSLLCEQAAEIAVLGGVVLAGFAAAAGPRRLLGGVLGAVAALGAVVTSAVEPGGAGHVVRQLFRVGEAGLPSTFVLAASVAAIAASAAAFATPGAAPVLFVLLATARHVDPALAPAVFAAGLLALELGDGRAASKRR
jgi:hypothetical protein